jgi:hypothetical protein
MGVAASRRILARVAATLVWLAATLVWVAGLAGPATAAPAPFTSSSMTAPANGAELFYDADTGSGSVTVSGTVTPASAATNGDVVCYAPQDTPLKVLATGIPVSGGSFSASVSLQGAASRACRLRFVPTGSTPSGTSAEAFSGPAISVSERETLSAGGSVYGYYILSGSLAWSYAFDSLGQCPVLNSFATDTATIGSYGLFDGNACLLQRSGVAPAQNTRAAAEVDGLNAYPPGAIAGLAGQPGFTPLSYTATFDDAHDTVSITETDPLEICNSPGGYPPNTTNCGNGLSPSGVTVTQTTTLMPGDQVTRVAQTFTSTDGNAHALDLLFSQSVIAPSGGSPAFEFPGQPVFAAHKAPDSFSLFPSGPSSIYVISDASAAPAVSNPIGAITYDQAPTRADFVSAGGAQVATFLMHYVQTIPAHGAWTLRWAFSQAADADNLGTLVQGERDRFFIPTLTVSRPRNGTTRTSPITVRGVATDPVGIASVTVNGIAAARSATGAFTAKLRLRAGRNTVRVIATNVAGNSVTVTRSVTYRPPPCVVPRLRGIRLAVARRDLHRHGCAVGRIMRVHSRAVRRGRVIASLPRAGARRRHGAKVRLRVSLGRAPRHRAHR